MISRATHDHPLFSFDNALVFSYLEEATRGTVPGASMKGYIRRKNGRGAFMAIVEQHAGEDKIKTQLKEKQHFLLNRRYTGQNNQLLEKFINQHRTAYTRLEECSERVDFQLPNGRTRVQYLLDAISCSFPPLQAAMAYINNDKLPDDVLDKILRLLLQHCLHIAQSGIIRIIAATLVELVVVVVVMLMRMSLL